MTYAMLFSVPVLLGFAVTSFEVWRDHRASKAKWARWKRCQEAS